jgi:hypothetical protein
MSRELFSQIIGPLNKGVNQQATSFVLPGFAKVLENGNCDLVEGLKKRLGSVPVKRIDTLTKNAGGLSLVNPIKWDEAWLFVYNRSSTERFIIVVADDSRTVSRTGNITNGSAVVTSVSSMTDLFVGAGVTGSGIPTGTTIVDIDVAGSRITLSKNATATTTGVTLTVESSYTFVSGISNVEPISGILPEVVPVEQVFANVSSTNLEYLRGSGRARDRFRATSFQDYVFITNIQKDTAYDSTETLTRYNIGNISGTYRPTKAQVLVKLVDYDTEYAITITLDNDDVIRGHYISPSLTDASGNANIVNTEQIATYLASKTQTITGSLTTNSNVVTGVNTTDIQSIAVQERVTGTGIPAGSFVGAITIGSPTSSFTLVNEAGAAANATANGNQVLTIGDGLTEGDVHNELNFTVKNSQILIGLNNSNRYFKSIVAHDARGNTLMTAFSNQVTSITELPTTSWDGYTVLVAPDGSEDKSTYYLTFNTENTTTAGTFGRGVWEEASGWGTRGLLDDNSMPHAFVYYRNSNGLVRFTFQPFSGTTYTDGSISIDIPGWERRLAGDEDKLPGPSFVGYPINDIVFFKNRLGFVSSENVILSESGAYYNFWQQSALQVIDSDPIDLTAVSNDVAVLNYALQQQDELVLFSTENQFRLYSGDNVTFSPETASVGRISSISMEAKVKPEQVGPQVMFPVKEGDFTGFHTFITTDRTVGINLGQTAVITETVPKYIPKNIDSLAVSRTDQYLAALSSEEPTALYVYQFFWEASGGSLSNRQNAWHKWTFPNKQIYWCDFVEGTLFKLVSYVNGANTEYYIEGINASRPPQESLDLFLLDRQISSAITTDVGTASFSYDAGTNKTTVTLPYRTVNPSQFVVIKQDSTDASESEKRWIVANNVPAGVTSFVCDSLGDFSSSSWVFGEKFEFKFQPPQLMPYSRTATDNTFIGNRTGRLQLRYLDIYYNDARYFTVEVTPKHRDTVTYEFDRRDPLNGNIVVSEEEPFEEAKFRAYIQSKNDQVTVELVNDSIDQAKFIALEWTGLYFDVARKYG